MKLSKAEVDAIIAASPRTFVPFSKLVLSEGYQARTAGTPKLSIAELAASIKESGVLQNLVVVEGARGRYEVCAGGRRLEALALLVSRNDIADNYPVPVLIVPADKALIASLAENCFHIPMHPADEFAAFAKLIGQGRSVEDVAAAFGVTPLVVKRRMKLATVSPKLMALFRDDKISLDCLMVLASVDDHEKQEQAWANLPSWNRHADYLRQLLTCGEIESDRHPVAKYVTVKAYEKAGGPSRRDLFSDDDKKVYLLDAALLEKLAIEKLQRKAKQVLAEGWKWVDVRTRYVYDEYVKYGELRKAKRPPTEQEAAELESLQGQIAERHNRMEELADQDGNEDEFYKLEQEAEALGAQVEAIEAALVVWPVEL
ncbi:MAG: ParB N-terminal domain-containing protein, partial [Thauera sp.]|nr:ParB N-terminal domain-containing protein [Thauera sp.]